LISQAVKVPLIAEQPHFQSVADILCKVLQNFLGPALFEDQTTYRYFIDHITGKNKYDGYWQN